MAFPETGILDDFNRVGEGPPPSADWANLINGLLVSGNTARGSTSNDFNVSYWDVETHGPDSECYAQAVDTINGDHVVPCVRLDPAGPDCYLAWFDMTGGDEIWVRRIDDGVETQLGAVIEGVNLGQGDWGGIEMIGDTLNIYVETGAGWSLEGTRTDGTYTAAGYIGLWGWGTSSYQDNFGGGSVVTAGNIKQIATIDWANVKALGTIAETSLKQVATVDAN